MLKRVLLILHICLFSSFLSTVLSANTDKIKAGTEKIIQGTISKIQVSVKGKKLQNYFENNTLDLLIDGEIKQYKFKEITYEVYSNDKLIESGNWKVGGLLKDNIKLKPKEKSKAYYFKKISKKNVIYSYDKRPGSEGVNKISVSIKNSENTNQTENVVEKKEKPKKEKSKKNKKIKYTDLTKKQLKRLKKAESESKLNKVIKKNENLIEISQPNSFSSSGEYMAANHCGKYKKFAFIFWDNLNFNNNFDETKGDIYICSKELILKNPETGSKLLWTNFDDEALYKYPEKHLYMYRYYFPPFRVSKTVKDIVKIKKKENPNFWKEDKITKGQAVYKDEESIHIKGTFTGLLNKKGIELAKTHCAKFDKYFYFYRDDWGVGKNNTVYVHCSKTNPQLSRISKSTVLQNSNDPSVQAVADINILNEIFKESFKGNSVNNTQLKKYNASSLTTFYFFEASDSLLSALELLYRAYDQNVEADQLKAQIKYNKESKYSEKDKLTSTKLIIDKSSVQINSKISDASLVLSELGRGYYEQSLPFAYNAAMNSYNLYLIVSSTKKNLTNSEDLLTGALENLNEIIGIAQVLPNIPEFTKNMTGTVKLIFSGAKSKKIRDKGNLSAALNELTLD